MKATWDPFTVLVQVAAAVALALALALLGTGDVWEGVLAADYCEKWPQIWPMQSRCGKRSQGGCAPHAWTESGPSCR